MPSVSFQFRAEGIDSVLSGIRRIKSESASTAKAVTSNAASASKAQVREADRAAKAEIRSAEKAAREKTRIAQKQLRDQERAYKKAQQYKRDSAKSDFKFMNGLMAGGVGLTISAVLGAAGLAASVISPIAGQVIDLQERARRLSISSRQPGEGFTSPDALASSFLSQGRQFGVDPNEVAAGGDAFVALTGDLKSFRQNMDILSNTTLATGASFEDVAKVAANLQNQFGITDRVGLENSIGAMVASGKSGSFEFRDSAGLMGRILSSGASYGLKGQGGLRQLLGLTQVARGSTGSAEMAATSVERVISNLLAKENKAILAGHGVKVDKGNLTGTIVDSILKTSSAEREKLFGEEGIRAIRPLATAADDAAKKTIAEAKAKGKVATAAEIESAKRNAIVDMLNRQSGAMGDWNEVLKDSAFAQESVAAKIQKVWSSIVDAAQGPVLIAVNKLSSMLSGSSDKIGSVGAAFGILAGIVLALGDVLMAVMEKISPGAGKKYKAVVESEKALSDNQKQQDEVLRKHQSGVEAATELADEIVAGAKRKGKKVTEEDRQNLIKTLTKPLDQAATDEMNKLSFEKGQGLTRSAEANKAFNEEIANAVNKGMDIGNNLPVVKSIKKLLGGDYLGAAWELSPATVGVDMLGDVANRFGAVLPEFNRASSDLKSSSDALNKASANLATRNGPTPQP